MYELATTTMMNPATMDKFINYIDRGKQTTTTYLANLNNFKAYYLYSGLEQVTREDICKYRDYLLSEHDAIRFDETSLTGWSYQRDNAGNVIRIACKPTTVRQYIQSVKQFFAWLSSEGLYADITKHINTPKIDTAQHAKDSLEPEEILTIENTIQATAQAKQDKALTYHKDTEGRIERATEQGKRLYAMYLLATNAGLRCIELERANIRDLEYKDGKAILYVYGKGRTSADQKKPIAKEVYDAIQDYLNSRTDRPTQNSPLFVATGNRSKGQRIVARTISQMLKKAMVQAGFNSERLTAHSLRHATGTNVMKLTGNNIYETQKYMRHCDPKTTEIYLNEDTTKQEQGIATDLYNLFHNKDTRDSRQKLDAILDGMTETQIQSLLTIASAMVK